MRLRGQSVSVGGDGGRPLRQSWRRSPSDPTGGTRRGTAQSEPVGGRLDIDYSTVRHHLDVLVEHELVETETGDYGSRYVLSAETERNWGEVERMIRTVS